MSPEKERQSGPDDEIPRLSFWAGVPKRTLTRVVLLLAMLAGILYLRQHTGAIAGCMSDAFRLPAPAQPSGVRLRAPVVLPAQPAPRAP
jgi:hypothetical protein